MIVKTVISGKEAIAACEKERFDIIFLDHMMPEMDGIETLKQLRKMQKESGQNILLLHLRQMQSVEQRKCLWRKVLMSLFQNRLRQ